MHLSYERAGGIENTETLGIGFCLHRLRHTMGAEYDYRLTPE